MATITIELPDEACATLGGTPEAFARDLRLAAAIEWYREGRVSQGRGAEIAGLNRWEFMLALSRVRVDPIQGLPDEPDAG